MGTSFTPVRRWGEGGGKGGVTQREVWEGSRRPLVLGKRHTAKGEEWAVASEDCAFGPIGFERVRDVQPGEMLVVSPTGQLTSFQCTEGETCPCIFEYIYLSRPDSVLNDISVYLFQLGLGTRLAHRILCAPPCAVPRLPLPFIYSVSAGALHLGRGNFITNIITKCKSVGPSVPQCSPHVTACQNPEATVRSQAVTCGEHWGDEGPKLCRGCSADSETWILHQACGTGGASLLMLARSEGECCGGANMRTLTLASVGK